MKTMQWKMKSAIGNLYLVASEGGLCGISWDSQSGIPFAKHLNHSDEATKILKRSVHQLEEYFAGRRMEFDLPLSLAGTPFQKKVWRELLKIPYGKTCSYQDVARRIKNAKAVRAVGSANGRNPVCILVPCHRVIAADGSLGGYSGSIGTKIKLLELEQRLIR